MKRPVGKQIGYEKSRQKTNYKCQCSGISHIEPLYETKMPLVIDTESSVSVTPATVPNTVICRLSCSL